ncbi:hypothetical protein HPB52_021399 [Rhipicephalus sanguineus]|uniref:Uncharacterized protein n=1 Tax=Rhipicephalus sanguineus TaxID=34632 RepID=A0A9D4PLU4_RHISA|nr:hypothetical protein HPB52_021399 [Rhipicephalus sanguineus]
MTQTSDHDGRRTNLEATEQVGDVKCAEVDEVSVGDADVDRHDGKEEAEEFRDVEAMAVEEEEAESAGGKEGIDAWEGAAHCADSEVEEGADEVAYNEEGKATTPDGIWDEMECVNANDTKVWFEIEDLLRLELFEYKRRDPLSVHGYLDIDKMDNGQFRTYFCFEQNDVRRLKSALLLPDVVRTPRDVSIPGDEALRLTLRPLAYPNRLRELEPLFGRHYSVISSATNVVLAHIENTFGYLLRDINNHVWLDLPKLEVFSQVRSDEM